MKYRWIVMLLIAPILVAQQPFDLQKAFELASKSVLVVHSINLRGEEVSLGSGIVIAPGEVVTNAHVVLNGTGAFLTKGSEKWEVKGIFLDPKLDLALLKTDPIPLPQVKLGMFAHVKPGQKLFAIGNPGGLELSLSDGVVSAVRDFEGTTYIQTTAPISPGSSGGGVFNTRCELVGITTFMFKDGQNLNFAISSDYIPQLRAIHIELKDIKIQKLLVPDATFLKLSVVQVMSNDQLSDLGRKGNPIAEEVLGYRLETGSNRINGQWVNNLPTDLYTATYWLNRAAEHGNNRAASSLANTYLNGGKRKKNLSEAKRLAFQIIKNIDTNYNIFTNSPFTKTNIKGQLSSASWILSSVYIEIGAKDGQPRTAMEALVWSEIMAELNEEELATGVAQLPDQMRANIVQLLKRHIDARDTLYENIGRVYGVPFLDEAKSRAKALMQGYDIVE